MTKFQFFLAASLITATLFLLIGDRNSNTIIPISLVIAVSSLVNHYIPETLWDKLATWVNRTAGRKIFKTRMKRLPPSKSRRIR